MMDSPRKLWSNTSYAVLTIFLVAFLYMGMVIYTPISELRGKKKYPFPDFDRILLSKMASSHEIDLTTNDRVVLIGDIHGMNHSLHKLLKKLDYKQDKDVLVFTGDMLAKTSHTGSLSLLDFFVENNMSMDNTTQRIFAVRGNHDQLIMQWRNWVEWYRDLNVPAKSTVGKDKTNPVKTGKEFLDLIEAEWAIERMRKEADVEEWVDTARKRAEDTWREEFWKRIPPPGKGKHYQEWKMFGDHYWLARDMTQAHADFLRSLPLILHVPRYHFFVVHGGMLPSDPKFPPTHPRQPLSHHPNKHHHTPGSPPHLSSLSRFFLNDIPPERQELLVKRSDNDSVSELRVMQEESLIHDIPQNLDWWNILNIRGVLKNGKVTRENEEGKPWSKLWNQQMKRCSGFDTSQALDDDNDDGESAEYRLTCEPSTVVYGHAASRGLDIKRWSKGLDTGCMYERELTALVLSQPKRKITADGPEDGFARTKHRFGDDDAGIQAHVVSVECVLPDDVKSSL
ncbi:Metallo-dependent phosphatase-like protein [Abortiporus biennis]|nr:Metallo-dependent phosphatase-like protein [Abortiporus biennis]